MTVDYLVGAVVLIVLCALFLKRRIRIKITKKGASLQIDAPL